MAGRPLLNLFWEFPRDLQERLFAVGGDEQLRYHLAVYLITKVWRLRP
jgi:hypothetical protein